MRFCTTHRACESAEDDICEVEALRWNATTLRSQPCTLVDALIVTKEDDLRAILDILIDAWEPVEWCVVHEAPRYDHVDCWFGHFQDRENPCQFESQIRVGP